MKYNKLKYIDNLSKSKLENFNFQTSTKWSDLENKISKNSALQNKSNERLFTSKILILSSLTIILVGLLFLSPGNDKPKSNAQNARAINISLSQNIKQHSEAKKIFKNPDKVLKNRNKVLVIVKKRIIIKDTVYMNR